MLSLEAIAVLTLLGTNEPMPCLKQLVGQSPRVLTVVGDDQDGLTHFLHTLSSTQILSVGTTVCLTPHKGTKVQCDLFIILMDHIDNVTNLLSCLKMLSIWNPYARILIFSSATTTFTNVESTLKPFWNENLLKVVAVFWNVHDNNKGPCSSLQLFMYCTCKRQKTPFTVKNISSTFYDGDNIFSEVRCEGNEIRMALHQVAPIIFDSITNGELIGLNGYLLRSLVQSLNMVPIWIRPSFNLSHGILLDNGTLIGEAGDVAYGKVDLGANSWFINSNWTNQVEFTYPHFKDNICLLVHKASHVPFSMVLFLPFSNETWIAICGSAIMASFGLAIFKRKTNIGQHILVRIGMAHLEMFEIFITGSFISHHMGVLGRLFLTILTVASLTLTSAFQGSLASFFTTPKNLPDINTLEEVLKTTTDVYASPDFRSLYQSLEEEDVMRKMADKIIDRKSQSDWNEAFLRTASSRKSALLTGEIGGRFMRSYKPLTKGGKALLHLVKECTLAPVYQSFMLTKGSPLFQRVNRKIQGMVEGGLVSQWQAITYYRCVLTGNILDVDTVNDDPIPLVLEHLQAAFFWLSIGLSSSALAFAVEMILRTLNHPSDVANKV